MQILQVQLFGKFLTVLDGVPVTTLNTPRLQALFAYLMLHPQVVFRHHLAAQFWPESSEAQARTNLRNLVHLLRQGLPNFEALIRSDAQTLQRQEDIPLHLDVHEFEQLLAFVPGSSPNLETLEKAVALYQGDLLPDCYDDWIFPERERLHHAYLAALEAAAEMAENRRDYLAALMHTRRLLQEDPLHAEANRQLIRLLALTGNQPAGLKAYQAYAGLLKRELGIDPEPETRALYEQLKKPAQPDESSGPAPAPLVGRHSEWNTLKATWQHASAGNPQVVMITGEAGIGKTRLVEELVGWATRQGLSPAFANCYPAEGGLPYAPVVTWLRSRPLPRLEKVWLSELSRLLPELLQAHPKLAAPAPITESWQRQRMFEALAKAMLEEQKPRLLVIEDIHWCDQDTLEWLHYLLRYTAHSPILIVATERSEENTAADHPLKKLQASLAAAHKLSQIKLHPLNETECYQLAAQTVEGGLLPEVAAHIFRESEGNPLFVVEMVRLGLPLQRLAQPPGEPAPIPEKVQAVLIRRIGQLSPETRELASLAATLGREFRLEVLRKASGMDESALVKALDELLGRRFVNEVARDRFDFSHDKLRQAVFSGLSNAHRRLLHRQAAEAYLNLGADGTPPREAEIASHYESAGMAQPAIHHYRLAAESAALLFSTADAIHNLERAIALAETARMEPASRISADEMALVLEKMGEMLALNGKYPQAQSYFEQSLAQAEGQPRFWRSQVYRKISDVLAARYLHEQAHAALDQAEQVLRISSASKTAAENTELLQVQLARVEQYYWDNHPDQMEAIISQIESAIEAHGTLTQQVQLLRLQSQMMMRRELYRPSQAAVVLARRRAELAEKLADPVDLAMAQMQFGLILLLYNDLEEARQWLSVGYEANTRVGSRIWQLRSLAYLGVASRKLNDRVSLDAQTRELLNLTADFHENTYYGIGLANLGWLAWQDGDQNQAEQLCKEAIAVWIACGGHAFQGLAYWVLLAIASTRQALSQAENTITALLDPDPKYRPQDEAIAVLLRQALIACQSQDASTAFNLIQQALEKAYAAREL